MKNKQAKINYADLWGLREEKYKFLEENDVNSTKWQELRPKQPYYFLVPKDFRSEDAYNKFLSVKDIFKFYNVGGKPGDDTLLVNYDSSGVKIKVEQTVSLLRLNPTQAKKEATKNLLKNLNNFEIEDQKIIPYNYRPFDIRYTYYDERIYTRPVIKVKSQFDHENIAILTTKILKAESFAHVFVSTIFPDVIHLSNKTSTNTFVFPLYLYEENEEQADLFDKDYKRTRHANISDHLWDRLVRTDLSQVLPEDIFYYVYSILYSNIYRQKYQEFLKIDFPRIPFTKDFNLFKQFAELGEQLVNLHLLKSPQLNNPISRFHGKNGNYVEKREYNHKEKRAYINNQQYFDNIEPEVWNYCIGGYQVLDKWLKDRKGRALSSEDVKHYCKVVTALSETIGIQQKIDKLYPGVEKNLIK